MIFPLAVLWHGIVGTEREVISELNARIADLKEQIKSLALANRLLRRAVSREVVGAKREVADALAAVREAAQ